MSSAILRLSTMAEFWLGKPVIALNTATYWHALRTCGIDGKVRGFGRLLAESQRILPLRQVTHRVPLPWRTPSASG
jgi:hypothetical protein